MSDLGGVWRTVGGRKIFIKDGEDLATAMKKSGKFKNKKDDKEEKIKQLKKKMEEAKGFFEKGKIKEEIEMLENGYDDLEKYRAMKEEKRQEAIKKSKIEKEERLKLKTKQEEEEEARGYKMAHRPSKGATLDDITKFDDKQDEYSPSLPKDFYEHPEYYGDMSKTTYKESFEAIKKARNNPNGTVKIYRATTGNEINDGDWITLSKTYAEHHKDTWLYGKGKVVEMEVPIKDVRFAGDDFNEFGYFPHKKK